MSSRYSSMVAGMPSTPGVGAGAQRRVVAEQGHGTLLDGGDAAEQRVGLDLLEQGLVAVHHNDVEVVKAVGLLGREGQRDGRGVGLLGEFGDACGQLDAQVDKVGGARVVGQVDVEGAQVARAHHHHGAPDVVADTVLLALLGDEGVGVLNELLGLGGLAQGSALGHGLLAPERLPGNLGEGDRGGDLGERVIVFLGHAGVGGQDDVGLAVVDSLEVEAVGVVKEHGGLGAQGLVGLGDPGPGAVFVDQAVVGGRVPHRRDAQGKRGLHVAPCEADHALGFLLDHGLAKGVLDGDGEGRGVSGAEGLGVGVLSIGGRLGLLVGAGDEGAGEGETGGAGQRGHTGGEGAAGEAEVHGKVLSVGSGCRGRAAPNMRV